MLRLGEHAGLRRRWLDSARARLDSTATSPAAARRTDTTARLQRVALRRYRRRCPSTRLTLQNLPQTHTLRVGAGMPATAAPMTCPRHCHGSTRIPVRDSTHGSPRCNHAPWYCVRRRTDPREYPHYSPAHIARRNGRRHGKQS